MACFTNVSDLLFTNVGFQLSLGLNFVLSTFGVVTNLFLIACFSQLTTSHKSIRILSCNLSVACVFASFYYMIRILLVWAQMDEPCKMQVKSNECNLITIPYNLALTSIILTMLGIAVDRWRASSGNYNIDSCKFGFGICILSWLSYTAVIPFLFLTGDPQLAEAPFCVSMVIANMKPNLVLSIAIVGAGITAMIAYLRLNSFNRGKLREFAIKQAQLSLDRRMEIRQTIEITSLFLPSLILHTLLWIAYFIILPFVVYEFKSDFVFRYCLAMVFYNLVAVFMFIHPIVLFLKSDRLRMKLKLLIKGLSQKNSLIAPMIMSTQIVDKRDDVETHFQALRNHWAQH